MAYKWGLLTTEPSPGMILQVDCIGGRYPLQYISIIQTKGILIPLIFPYPMVSYSLKTGLPQRENTLPTNHFQVRAVRFREEVFLQRWHWGGVRGTLRFPMDFPIKTSRYKRGASGTNSPSSAKAGKSSTVADSNLTTRDVFVRPPQQAEEEILFASGMAKIYLFNILYVLFI